MVPNEASNCVLFVYVLLCKAEYFIVLWNLQFRGMHYTWVDILYLVNSRGCFCPHTFFWTMDLVMLKLRIYGSAITLLTRTLLPLELLLEYRMELVTMEFLCIHSVFLTKIFCRGVAAFATDCPMIWCGGFTSCLLLVLLFINHKSET